jgi:hypothetical protein
MSALTLGVVRATGGGAHTEDAERPERVFPRGVWEQEVSLWWLNSLVATLGVATARSPLVREKTWIGRLGDHSRPRAQPGLWPRIADPGAL